MRERESLDHKQLSAKERPSIGSRDHHTGSSSYEERHEANEIKPDGSTYGADCVDDPVLYVGLQWTKQAEERTAKDQRVDDGD